MEYRLGNANKIKDKGQLSKPLECPNCKNEVIFSVFSNGETRLDAKTFIKTGNVYFLICPKCASVFTMDESLGKSLKKKDTVVWTSDLLNPEEFKKHD